MENKDVRLGKRLAYLLRYGAEKEGLTVREGGIYYYYLVYTCSINI